MTAPENAQTLTTVMPDLVPSKEESTTTSATQPKKKEEKKEVSTSNLEETESPQESKPKEKEKEPEEKAPKVPTGKSLVPGFGLTMSLDVLNSGIQLNEIQLNDVLTLIQEQEYDRQQNILLDLVFQDDVDAGLDSIANIRWRSLLRDNPLQQDAFGD